MHNKSIFCILVIIFIFLSFSNNNIAYGLSEIETKNDRVIYLTFDDGPSIITNNILNILKQYNIKATFFLIGNQIKGNEDVVKRIDNEGHSIGLHSYTHKFKKIYSSKEAFIKEMHDTRDEINRVTGTSPNIIRFPGGSRNRLNDEMLLLLHSCNYKIYDWNIDCSDGINPKASVNKLYRKATCEKVKPQPIILLMHCDYMHKNTCKALPMIIQYYKSKGYKFEVISEDTIELYYLCK